MAKKLEIQVIQDTNSLSEFELTTEIVAGSLTSNAKELKARIEEELKNYSVEKYIDNPDAAKSDKALLNKVKDSVATKRKEISAKWNQPLEDFLSEMKTLEKSISDASDKINVIVKDAENKEKAEKRNWIENYWKTLDFNIVSLDKIFNQKWLNKTYKTDQIMLDVENITEKITTELATLRSMNDEDKDVLMNFYLDTLDLNATLQKGNQLKANRKLLQQQNEEWKQKKLEEEQKQATEKTVQVLEKSNLIPQQKSIQPDQMTFTLKLKGTRKQLWGLKNYIVQNGIDYIKIEDEK